MKKPFENPSVEFIQLSEIVPFGDLPEMGGDVVSKPGLFPGDDGEEGINP